MRDRFHDRTEAGRMLATELEQYANRDDVLVLALPRGGVPVAFQVALKLNAPLDVYIVRKLGVPQQPELAMGAIGGGGVQVINQDVVQTAGISRETISRVAKEEYRELKRREQAYRGDRSSPAITGNIVILVDDGVATGSTMYAAIQAIKQQHPSRLIVATPVAHPSTHWRLAQEVDEAISLITPEHFYGVGQWYENFNQTTDEEVREYLDKARHYYHSNKGIDSPRS